MCQCNVPVGPGMKLFIWGKKKNDMFNWTYCLNRLTYNLKSQQPIQKKKKTYCLILSTRFFRKVSNCAGFLIPKSFILPSMVLIMLFLKSSTNIYNEYILILNITRGNLLACNNNYVFLFDYLVVNQSSPFFGRYSVYVQQHGLRGNGRGRGRIGHDFCVRFGPEVWKHFDDGQRWNSYARRTTT